VSPSSLKSHVLGNSKPVKSLKKFFNENSEIILAFVYGSYASKRISRSSDVDIGILFETIPPMEAIDDITEALSSILTREVDLVILNQASPILKMQILRNGILLYASKRTYFHQFYTDTVNQYDDLKRIRKKCEENILKGRIYAG
jgi:predicted nucleotidyltransferase